MARCPLHGERTPSLSVSPEKGVYYCFGCQRSGDAISFVQEMDGLDFAGAVESLASSVRHSAAVHVGGGGLPAPGTQEVVAGCRRAKRSTSITTAC